MKCFLWWFHAWSKWSGSKEGKNEWGCCADAQDRTCMRCGVIQRRLL